LLLQTQVIKTIHIFEGGLPSFVNRNEKYDIAHFTLTGKINARDFKTMRDCLLPHLSVVDLSGSRIVAYSTKGYDDKNYFYSRTYAKPYLKDPAGKLCCPTPRK